MKYRFSLILTLLFSSTVFVFPVFASTQTYDVPSPACVAVGNQPCIQTTSTSPSPEQNTVSPGASTGSPSIQPSISANISGTPSNSPSPSSAAPCSLSSSSLSSQSTGTVSALSRHHRGKWHRAGRQGFLQQLMQWLLQLLQLLFQQLGLKIPNTTNPCPTPSAAPSSGASSPSSIPSPGTQTSPVASPSTTASSSATRDPLKQPFASTSIWNMPIGSGAKYVAINMPANPGADDYTPMPQIDDEHIVLRPTAPMTVINYSSAGWSGSSRCNSTGSGGNLPVSVPIPANYVVPNDNTNSVAAFLMADGRTIVQTQPLARCTAGGSATSIIKVPNVDLYGDGIIGSHGGSDLSGIGGSIRVGELRPGQQGPKHALKLNVDSPVVLYNCKTDSDCYRWPASVADSGAVGDYGSQNPSPNPAMKMGALLAIPPSISINSLGLESVPGKELAWTLQNYGAYVVDSTGGAAYAISAENGPDGSVRTQFQNDYGYPLEERINSNTPWSHDFQILMTKLYVVDNNSATSIGGGGTPRQPLAPPISPPK